MILDYTDFLMEGSSKKDQSFEIFAGHRLEGATKIANTSHEKGGDALLTYHHFKVKLPYYKKASQGAFDFESAEEELETKLKQLNKGLSGNMSITQVEFQKLMGEIEVLGELLIKHK